MVLSGPSCVGKGPLYSALCKFYPEAAEKLAKVVLYNSRSPRPGELDGVDYHFRQREDIEKLRASDDFKVLDVRGDLQALDIRELRQSLQGGDVFFEGNPFVGVELLNLGRAEGISCVSAFLSPLSRDEVRYLTAPERDVNVSELLTDVMQRKLLRRTKKQKTNLSLKDLENIEKRASSAYRELQEAWQFDWVIVNHDGEDSENWDAFYYPLADARSAMECFASLLEQREPAGAEKWEQDLLG